MEKARECNFCTKPFEKSMRTFLIACPCRKVTYCDKECQGLHWNSGHKEECEIRRKAKAKAKAQSTPSSSQPAMFNPNDVSSCSGIQPNSRDEKKKSNTDRDTANESVCSGIQSQLQADKKQSTGDTPDTEEHGQSTSSVKEVRFKVGKKKEKPKKLESKKKLNAATDKVWLKAGQKKEKLFKKKKSGDKPMKRGEDGLFESTNEAVLRSTKCKDNYKSFQKAKGALQDIIDRNQEWKLGQWAFRIDCQKEGKYVRAESHNWQSTNYKQMIGLEKKEVLDAASSGSDEDEGTTRPKRVCIHCRKEITGPQWSYIKCKAQKCWKRMAHFSCLGFPDITKELSTAMKEEYYCVGCHEAKENEELEEGDFADDKSQKRKRKTKNKKTSLDKGVDSKTKKSNQSRNRGQDTEDQSSSVESDGDKESASNYQKSSLASKEGLSSEGSRSSDVDDDVRSETLNMDGQPVQELDSEPSHSGHASQEKEESPSVKVKNRRLSRSKTKPHDSDEDFRH